MSKRPPFEPMIYADHMKSSGDFALLNGMLHNWTGANWQKMSTEDAERHALNWIVAHPTGAIIGSDQARKAANTAQLWVQQLERLETEDVLIPLKNGYLHYDGGEFVLRPHDQALAVDYVINCDYDPTAPVPKLFLGFVERVLPDSASRGRVQEYLGYTLMNDARYQRGQVWIGSGANGKGVLANIIQEFHANVATLNLGELGGFNLSHLLGASLVYVDEVPACKIDDGILKKLIAGETAAIRMHYRPTINARVLAKWLILSNSTLRVEDQSDGFWRRFDMVPFGVTIPESERNPLLAQKIIKLEMRGVLNWLLEGLGRLLTRGRFDPVKPAAIAALDNYAKTRADSVRGWMDDAEIGLSPVVATHKTAVYLAYRLWCSENGLQAQTSQRFWTGLAGALPGLNSDQRIIDEKGKKVRACNVLLEA